jgi:hypothetical protein
MSWRHRWVVSRRCEACSVALIEGCRRFVRSPGAQMRASDRALAVLAGDGYELIQDGAPLHHGASRIRAPINSLRVAMLTRLATSLHSGRIVRSEAGYVRRAHRHHATGSSSGESMGVSLSCRPTPLPCTVRVTAAQGPREMRCTARQCRMR